MMPHILIIDDEKDIRSLLKEILEDEGYHASEAAHSEAALASIQQNKPDLMILDIWLENSDMDGMEILEHVKKTHPDIPVLMISGHGNIEMAVKAMKLGAYEFIEKPFNSDRLLMMIERALEAGKLVSENLGLKKKIDLFDEFTAVDPKTVAIRQALEKHAGGNSRIMITGLSGSGKTLLARTVHDLSSVAKGAFVILECTGMAAQNEAGQKSYLDSVLLQAKGGSCVLQNIHDMPKPMQGMLVSMLQNAEISAQIRFISTAHSAIVQMVKQGQFKEDLFYRLNVVQIDVPSLKDRKQDIPELAAYYLRKFFTARGKAAPKIQDDALLVLQKFDWPGNVRQIKNTMENIAMTHLEAGLMMLKAEHLPSDIRGFMTGAKTGHGEVQGGTDVGALVLNWLSLPLKDARAFFEKFYIEAQMDRFGGNISKAADYIGMERTALHRKIKSLEELGGSFEGQISTKEDKEDQVQPLKAATSRGQAS